MSSASRSIVTDVFLFDDADEETALGFTTMVEVRDGGNVFRSSFAWPCLDT